MFLLSPFQSELNASIAFILSPEPYCPFRYPYLMRFADRRKWKKICLEVEFF